MGVYRLRQSVICGMGRSRAIVRGFFAEHLASADWGGNAQEGEQRKAEREKMKGVFFKLILKHRLQNWIQATTDDSSHFCVTSCPEESVAAANASLTDGVTTKDIHIDPFTSLSVRIFLPESTLKPPLCRFQAPAQAPH
ncbi:hypothetical protein CDL15_Pgr002269 [Punica granatum]|uniref:Uncharacterized protein n=1 Tax=Punica granatum TaxID=22663 RepID=A0A218WG19_PUNGR|nr:hypothetical protein CDL15_Pgr002269 [Punica granatum]